MLKIRRLIFSCLIVFVVSLSFAEPRSVTILHVNDIHGHFLPEPAHWRNDKALIGGFATLSHYLRENRAQHPEALFLHAGDLMTGNPICNFEHRGVKGGALVELLEKLGCDADVIGNHEFDISQENTRKLSELSSHPTLCANIVRNDGRLFAPHAVVQRDVNGLRIGIIGLTLQELPHMTTPKHLRGLQILDIAETAQKYIDELDPVTDLIILLTHNGFDEDRKLAQNVHGADVIVGGHSHTRLTQPVRENGILIVQAGCYLQNLGVLHLNVDGDTVQSYEGQLIPLLAKGTQPDAQVAAFCDSFKILIDAEYGQVIGQLAVDWKSRYREESNVGNWICDRLREAFNGDVALVNAGGIRIDIPAGPVTKLHIVELLPFNNSIVAFSATGAQLQKFAMEQASAQVHREHGIVQMSGMKITYRRSGGEVESVACEVGGEALNPKRKYRIISIDYVAVSQWERYLTFEPQAIQRTSELLSDFIIKEVDKTEEPIHSRVEGRLGLSTDWRE